MFVEILSFKMFISNVFDSSVRTSSYFKPGFVKPEVVCDQVLNHWYLSAAESHFPDRCALTDSRRC